MRTYREVFKVPEFTPLFVVSCVRYAAGTMSGLALATLVYARTGSPLLSALSMFGASFAQVVGAATLLSLSDRVRPRAAMITLGLIFTVATSALAIPAAPVWALLLIELVTGLVSAAGGGIQWGLVNEILPEGGYILGRSVFNMASGVMQIVGFAAGGAVIALLSARGALLFAAALFLGSAALIRLCLRERPARSAGRASIRETWTGNRELWSVPARRNVYLAMWVPNGLIVGCEALFVPYAPHAAGVFFVAAAAGMLAGDTALGRFVPVRWRGRLISPLRLLLAAPYLLFAFGLPAPIAVAAVVIASVGYGASLLLQDRLLAMTPPNLRGQALGLHSSGMLTMQAVGATIAGTLAGHLSPAVSMTVLAVASLVITVALTPGLVRPLPVAEPVAV
ncbi:MAG TPA: MFS transporter [Micromonosporaceae bacterium]